MALGVVVEGDETVRLAVGLQRGDGALEELLLVRRRRDAIGLAQPVVDVAAVGVDGGIGEDLPPSTTRPPEWSVWTWVRTTSSTRSGE